MLLFPNVSILAKFSPAVNVGCVAAAAGERAAVTRSRQLHAPAHCTQLPPAAAGGSSLQLRGGSSLQQLQLVGGKTSSLQQLGSGGLSTHCSLAPAHW